MDGYRCFTWDAEKFPEPRKMISDLQKMGFQIISIIDPGIKVDENYAVYQKGIVQKCFLFDKNKKLYSANVWPGECVFPDFLDERVRDWWGELYKKLLEDGISGIWNDMNEPSTFSVRRTFPEKVMHSIDDRYESHQEVHNVYGMQMVRATFDGLRKLRPEKRPFILSRSGYSGIQKFSWTWTGDNEASWEHLRLSIPKCLGIGLSGHAGVGPDIGGFRGIPTPELFARWIQLGVFYPLFRTHTMQGTPDQEPWSFGEEVERIARKYINLRYRLIPYIYTQFRESTINGSPLMRPLFFEFPDDPNCYDSRWENTEFLFGSSLLIAPILRDGQRERELYLPKGHWFEFESMVKYDGGQVINISAPLDYIPIFVKSGSIISLRKEVKSNTVENTNVPFEFKVIGGRDSLGLLYIDDYLSTKYESGEFGLYQINHEGELKLIEGKEMISNKIN